MDTAPDGHTHHQGAEGGHKAGLSGLQPHQLGLVLAHQALQVDDLLGRPGLHFGEAVGLGAQVFDRHALHQQLLVGGGQAGLQAAQGLLQHLGPVWR